MADLPAAGITIQWDGATHVSVILDPRYQGQVCGLCGNFDGSAGNDFRARTGQIENNAVSFANTWRTREACAWAAPAPSVCAANPERENWAKSACDVIKSDTFAECHNVVS